MVDAKINERATLVKSGILPWTFMPTGIFLVNGVETDAHIGELIFKDGHMRTNAAVQARDWAFCLVRTMDDPTPEHEWVLGGFHGNDLCFFCQVKGTPDPRPPFTIMIVNLFWPLLYPDNPCKLIEKQPFKVTKKTRFDNPSDIGAMQRFALTGGTRSTIPPAVDQTYTRLSALLADLEFDSVTIGRAGAFHKRCICKTGGHRSLPSGDVEIDAPALEIRADGDVVVILDNDTAARVATKRLPFGIHEIEDAAALLIAHWGNDAQEEEEEEEEGLPGISPRDDGSNKSNHF